VRHSRSRKPDLPQDSDEPQVFEVAFRPFPRSCSYRFPGDVPERAAYPRPIACRIRSKPSPRASAIKAANAKSWWSSSAIAADRGVRLVACSDWHDRRPLQSAGSCRPRWIPDRSVRDQVRFSSKPRTTFLICREVRRAIVLFTDVASLRDLKESRIRRPIDGLPAIGIEVRPAPAKTSSKPSIRSCPWYGGEQVLPPQVRVTFSQDTQKPRMLGELEEQPHHGRPARPHFIVASPWAARRPDRRHRRPRSSERIRMLAVFGISINIVRAVQPDHGDRQRSTRHPSWSSSPIAAFDGMIAAPPMLSHPAHGVARFFPRSTTISAASARAFWSV